MTVYLIIDESGEKGYSRKMSKDDDKFGTMVGYFLFDNQIKIFRDFVKDRFSQFSNDGKLHITDLSKEEEKKLLREHALKFLEANRINWIHMSIHVSGFKRFSLNDNLLMHAELFMGIFIKAISYIYDVTRSKKINLKVISDTLDKTTIKEFEKTIKLLKNMMCGQRKDTARLTNWSPSEKKVINYTRESTFEFDENMFLLDELTIDITCEDSELTLIADVLSNTTYYHLNQELRIDSKTNLDAIQSLRNHPLVHLVYGCYDHTKENSMDYFEAVYGKR